MSTILTKDIVSFTDIDFDFGLNPVSNNVNVKKNANAIKQSVINLLMLKQGDKPFHPEIKSPVYFHLFDNFSMVVSSIVEDDIKRFLNFYEPRINVTVVNISTPNPNDIKFEIVGTIKNTTEQFMVNFLINRLR
jgi:phage baseplate assembly protein W